MNLDYVFHFNFHNSAWQSYEASEKPQFIDDSYLHEFFALFTVLVSGLFYFFNLYYLICGVKTMWLNTSRYEAEIKKVRGDPHMQGWKGVKYWMGSDWYFWLLPCSPSLQIDYLQRTFPLETEKEEVRPPKTIYRVQENLVFRCLSVFEILFFLSTLVFVATLPEGIVTDFLFAYL